MVNVRTSRQMFETFLRTLKEREKALGEEFERVKYGLTSVQQEIQSVEAYLDKEPPCERSSASASAAGSTES